MTLEEQQAICDAATGPSWEAREVGHEKRTFRVEIVAPQYTYGRRTHSRYICQIVDYCEWNDHPANAKFIVAARTEWPNLITEHRRALAEIERLKEAGKILVEYSRSANRASYFDTPAVEMDNNERIACKVFDK